jgi:hypothetical protein
MTLKLAYIGPEATAIYCGSTLTPPGDCADEEAPSGFDDWTGHIVKAYEMIAERAGFTIQQHYVTAAAKEMSSSRWTQCVYDVQMGNCDVCVGDFYMTPERWGLAPFTTPYSTVLVGMWVPLSGNEDMTLYDMVQKTFAPFEPSLWGALLCTAVFSALVYVFFEMGHNEDEFPDDGDGPADDIAISLYMQGQAAMSGGITCSPMTDEGRLFLTGWGFFCLIAISSYTASMAAFLTQGNSGEYGSIEDAVSKGARFCGTHSIKAPMHAQYPNMAFVSKSGSEKIAGYEAGECDVILDRLTHAKLGMVEPYCHWKVVGQPAISISIAQPVRTTTIMSGLSYHLASMRMNGEMKTLEDDFQAQSACAAKEEASADRFGVSSMAGAYAVLLLFTLLAFANFAYKKLMLRKSLKQHYKDKALEAHFKKCQAAKKKTSEAHNPSQPWVKEAAQQQGVDPETLGAGISAGGDVEMTGNPLSVGKGVEVAVASAEDASGVAVAAALQRLQRVQAEQSKMLKLLLDAKNGHAKQASI